MPSTSVNETVQVWFETFRPTPPHNDRTVLASAQTESHSRGMDTMGARSRHVEVCGDVYENVCGGSVYENVVSMSAYENVCGGSVYENACVADYVCMSAYENVCVADYVCVFVYENVCVCVSVHESVCVS